MPRYLLMTAWAAVELTIMALAANQRITMQQGAWLAALALVLDVIVFLLVRSPKGDSYAPPPLTPAPRSPNTDPRRRAALPSWLPDAQRGDITDPATDRDEPTHLTIANGNSQPSVHTIRAYPIADQHTPDWLREV